MFVTSILLLLCASLIILNYGCNKEEEILELDVPSKMMKFKNYQEYHETLSSVLSMSYDERKKWEYNNGFKSLGMICDELYQTIIPENFNSLEEVKDFVKKNEKFLVLINDDVEGMTLETVFSNVSCRYFLNSERIFRIHNLLYKALEDGFAIASLESYSVLKKIESSCEINSKSEISFIPYEYHKNDFIDTKDNENNCGSYKSLPGDNGSDRVRITIELGAIWGQETHYSASGKPYIVDVTYINNHAEVRPYFRRLGIWWRCKRTISCDLKVAVDFYTNFGWLRSNFFQQESGINDWALEYVMQGVTLPGHIYPIMHFGGYDCWGRTPSGGGTIVEIECNPHLF